VLLERQRAVQNFREAVSLAHEGKGRKAKRLQVLADWNLGKALSGIREFTEADALIGPTVQFYNRELSLEAAGAHLALGTSLARQGQLTEALSSGREALAIHEQIGETTSVQFANIHGLLGYLSWKTDRFETARTHLETAERVFLHIGGPDSDWLGALSINLGGLYDDMGLARKSVDQYRRAHRIFSALDNEHPFFWMIYNNWGNAYSDLGEYTLAIRYLEAAIQLNPTGRYHNNLGNVYLEKGDLANAEKHFELALAKLSAASEIDSSELARPYHNLAILYRQRGQHERAIDFDRRSLPYRMAAGGLYQMDVARTYQGLVDSHLALSQSTQAMAYLDTTLLIQQTLVTSGQHPELIATYLSKAGIARAQNDATLARACYKEAIRASGYQPDDFSGIHAPAAFLAAMHAKGHFLLNRYQSNGDLQDLSEAHQTFREAVTAIGHFRQTLVEEASKTDLTGAYFTLFEGAINTAYLLYQFDPGRKELPAEAFSYAEQSKSLTLLESIQQSRALVFAGIPSDLLEREQELRERINYEEKELIRLNEEAAQVADPAIRSLRETIFQRNLQYQYLQERFERDYPEYYRLKHATTVVSLEEVSRRLSQTGQAILEYVVGEENIFLFLIRSDEFQLLKIRKDFPLSDWIQQMREGMTTYHTTAAPPDLLKIRMQQQYAEVAHQLFRKLIAPVEDQLPDRLLIIPDGVLGYLPFEALLTELPNRPDRFHTHAYLLRDHAISYSYSATLLEEVEEKRQISAPRPGALAFAPFYDGDQTELSQLQAYTPPSSLRSGFQPLAFSGEEVYQVKRLMGGEALIGKDATEEAFRKHCGAYRILHLSTHGKADDRSSDLSYLAFTPIDDGEENELLYVRDLYNLRLNADLVVLSACETGIGRLQRGEGIISLARAFTYAGAKSIVTTLWSVSDAKSKFLVTRFYEYLTKGVSKDRALQRAKLDLLETFAGEAADPFYWAGFVGVGSMTPIAN